MTTRHRVILLGAVLPVLFALAGAFLAVLVLPDLPDPVAVHWGLDGPDSAGPAWMIVVIGSVLPLPMVVLALVAGRPDAQGRLGAGQRVLVATAPFLAVLLGVLSAGMLLVQRGLDDWRDAPSIGLPLVAGLGAGLVLAAITWFALPGGADEMRPAAVEPMPLARGERAVWVRRLTPARSGVVVLTAAFAIMLASIGFMWALSPLPLAVGFTVVIGAIALLTVGSLSWRVSIGADGLRARPVVGFRIHVPLDDIAEVTTVQVQPLRDFGGWGYRMGPSGRWGLVLRGGEAIEVVRRDGRRLTVATPGAGEGAALLRTLADRGSD